MNIWGNNIKLSLFGESHGEMIGISIDGLPSGFKLDIDKIKEFMGRRAPGKNRYSTTRREKDEFHIVSGVLDNVTTGASLTALIYNTNTKSKDYSKIKYTPRPSHADYPAFIKYNSFNDIRGGGTFSGRLTAPIVLAGSIARLILKEHNIEIFSHIKQIGNIIDDDIENQNKDILNRLQKEDFPCINNKSKINMQELIEKTRVSQDSIGGIIEVMAKNLPIALGSPFFDSMESTISHLMFSIPAVKGIEFGLGFDFAKSFGSEVNDFYFYEDDKVKLKTNNNGGILGGLTTGAPIVARIAIKPTPSIGKKQKTINLLTKQNEILEIQGRHDPCIVPRACVVVESMMAIAILEHMGGKL